ncbi:MAG: 30S ribosomal protein S2 [Patescibacteria group bacterium]
MSLPTLIELAESGAHYGHHRSYVYPKAKRFVFGVRKNVALIDLEKTLACLTEAQKVIALNRAEGKTVLFVGTRRGVKDIIKKVAEGVGEPYVTERWLGGFLTNFEGIHENIKKMNELDEYLTSEHSKGLTKIERLRQTNKLARYHRFLAGVTNLNAVPGLMVMASASEDKIALKEANLLGIPIIAICDTDTNPDKITYPIPANDDAAKAVELILQALVSTPAKAAKAEVAELKSPAFAEASVGKQSSKVKTETKKSKVSEPKTAKKVTVKKDAPAKKSAVKAKTAVKAKPKK